MPKDVPPSHHDRVPITIRFGEGFRLLAPDSIKCPWCLTPITGAGTLSVGYKQEPPVHPESGDMGLCMGCAGLFVYTRHGTDARRATIKDVEMLDAEDEDAAATMLLAQRKLREVIADTGERRL